MKVADGFKDPINLANAGDGSGRIFVVERIGRIKIVNKDGSVNEDPFLDLTSINPLGNDAQTGFVEQGLYAVAFHPKFKDNGYFYVHYASLPFNGDLFIAEVGQNHWEEIIYQPASSKGGKNYGWPRMEASFCHPVTGDPAGKACSVVGVLPAAQYPYQKPYPGAAELKKDHGCSAQGFGVANYGGMEGVYLLGDWCSGRVYGLGWDKDAKKWRFQEMMQTNLQFTAGGYDEDGKVLDDSPIEFKYRPNQKITSAVKQMHLTGKNVYEGDAAAIKKGKKLYSKLCKGCHLKDGTGRIGPSIVDDEWKYPRTTTDKGMFEIIYAGGAGAMQAFGKRVDQDVILRVMAYLTVLRKK